MYNCKQRKYIMADTNQEKVTAAIQDLHETMSIHEIAKLVANDLSDRYNYWASLFEGSNSYLSKEFIEIRDYFDSIIGVMSRNGY